MAKASAKPTAIVETSPAPKEPRHPNLWASVVYAVATLSLAYPALLGKFLVSNHSDQYIAGYAFREFAAQSLRSGHGFPQWNPYLFGGMPYIAAMHGDIFYPTFLLRMVMPTDQAMTWGFAIHVFLAGIFTFIFLRAATEGHHSAPGNPSAANRLGFFPCLIGGLSYMLAGQIASLVSPGHDGKLFVSALFPLGLWALIRGVRDGRHWAFGAFALIIGLAVLSPHPQLLQYTLLASGTYGIFLIFKARRQGVAGAIIARRALLAFIAVGIGAAIGAVQYLPVREYVAWSPRAGGLPDYSTATSYAWNPEEVFNAYLPQFTGMLDAYWGRNGIHLHSEYIGVMVLMLMGAAWVGLKRNERQRQILFWTVTLIVALLWAMGGSTPFYRIPYALIPGTKFFRAPQTIFFVGTLAIAFLTACGVERILNFKVGRRYFLGWAIAAVVIGLLASIGGLNGIARSLAPEEMIDRVDANSRALIFGAWRSALFVLLGAGAFFVYRRKQLTATAFVSLLALLVAADLWTVMRSYWIFSPPASVLYASDPAIDYLRKQDQPARVLAVPLAETEHRDPNLLYDGLMVHRIRTVIGYHGNELGRYDQLTGKDEGYRPILSPLLWRLTNTRFVLTNVDSLPTVQKIIGPVRDASGTAVYLYKTQNDNPYAWVASARFKAPDAQVRQTILDPRLDLRSVALFDTSARIKTLQQVGQLPAPSTIDVIVDRYAPGSVDLHLAAPAPEGSALVVAENYYPGWTATSAGKALPLDRADFSLIGVELPAGATKISLAFRSSTYEKGKVITLVALVVSILMIAGGVAADRRRVA